MKTGKNIATNNFIVRLWSHKHYQGKTAKVRDTTFDGTITDVKSKENKHFHSVGDFLKAVEVMNRKAEKNR